MGEGIDAEHRRWHGTWAPLTPATIGGFMAGFDRPWWVVGGWAIEAFTGTTRPHGDLDVSILSCDVEAFRAFLGERWTPWNVDDGWFRPLDDEHTEVDPESQLWVRRDASSPWVLDVPITRATDGRWTSKRDHADVRPVDEVTRIGVDGLRYLNPEIVLMIKGRLHREKDRADLDAALPVLDDEQRTWLRDTFIQVYGTDHPWSGLL